MEKIWLKNYPHGIRHEIQVDRYQSVSDLFHESCEKFSSRTAYIHLGTHLSFRELEHLATQFASFLQNELKLEKGDTIALQMPNLIQYPVALFGALKAGLIVVNTNPLYTEREMSYQFKDSGVKAIVILANFADKLESILHETQIKHVIITQVGDLLGWPKSAVINFTLKYIKKMIPSHGIKHSYSFYESLDLGKKNTFRSPGLLPHDRAFLQYTGGTTGLSKGAILTHQNIIANMLQVSEWMKPILVEGEEIALTPLPLYHIFSLTVNCLTLIKYGATNILITNPKDLKDFIKTMKAYPFTFLTGVNTLFNALMNHPDFNSISFNKLKVSVAGGMALHTSVADQWTKRTRSAIIEGYGLTETSPVVCCNPIHGLRPGTIGLPFPSLDIQILNDEGVPVPLGESGELCVKGPNVMEGYWNQPEETKNCLSAEGWLKTGDIATMDSDGYIKIVDRKKDLIIVSGFNVYPNEIEEVLSQHKKIAEVAAVGVEDEHSGESVKVFIVPKDPSLTTDEVLRFCKQELVAYKRPKYIIFKNELPKTNVGKILRRKLKEKE